MEVREISSLGLAPGVVDKLLKNGFRVLKDVHGLRPTELAQEAGLSTDEAQEVLQAITRNAAQTPVLGSAMSAKQLLQKSSGRRQIITFCKAIDTMLGGGIAIGQSTEICGVPGIGKTQLSMQLSVNVQIPAVCGGVGGKAIFIDTEGSMMVERLAEMAESLVQHLRLIAQKQQQPAISQQVAQVTTESLLENIFVFRVHDQTEQVAIIRSLPAFIESHPEVKLCVCDSVAFHFRQDLSDTAARARQLSTLAQLFNSLAHNHDIAVVLINQVTTKLERTHAHGDGAARLVPALGESWSHAITSRMMLHWQDETRRARLVKCPYRKCDDVSYRVCEAGVRDILNEAADIPQKKLRIV